MGVRTLKVPKERKGKRLDQFLAGELPGLTLARAQELLRSGRVRIRGKVAAAERKLWGGEEVEVDVPAPRAAAQVEGPPLQVLARSGDVVIVDKPPGLVVEPATGEVSMVELVAAAVPGIDVAGSSMPGVVHRLDRETSGCLALACTERGVAEMKAAFEARRVKKLYLALVLGEPPDQARLEGPYARDPRNPRLYTARVQSPRRAALSFRTLERLGQGCALVEVSLETGRTHQIRVQLSEAGLPLIGDPLYGPKEVRVHPAAAALGRLALHAERLEVTGLTDGPLRAQAPVPEDFGRALALLRGGTP